MPKSTKKSAAKPPRRKRVTIEERLNEARQAGVYQGVKEEFERRNNAGVAHAVQLNGKLHGVLSSLQGVATELAKASNLLADVIRGNTPTPRDSFRQVFGGTERE